jgi:hypothetical protein
MSEAGDDIQVDAPPAQVEATAEAAVKGKLSVEEALQVRSSILYIQGRLLTLSYSKF